MQGNTRASKRTVLNLGSLGTVSENSITVFGWTVANGAETDALIEFLDTDLNTEFYVAVKAHEFEDSDIDWLADNGLKVASLDKNIHVTVWHSQDGS